MSDYSPERPCATCGVGVQTYTGRRAVGPMVVVAGTLVRHYHHREMPQGSLRECEGCEEPVYRFEDEDWDWRCATLPMVAWQRHQCSVGYETL